MKALVSKLFSAIASHLRAIVMNRTYLWLIIIGLLLFIGSLTLMMIFHYKTLSIQFIISISIVAVYIVIIGACYLFKYLVSKKAFSNISKQAQGFLQANTQDSEQLYRFSYKRYFYHKLNLKTYLPLCLQRLYQTKKIYLCMGETKSLHDSLQKNSWIKLDNPNNFSMQLWVKSNIILIVLNDNDPYNDFVLKLLAKYSLLKSLSGLCFIAAAKSLCELHLAKDVKQQQQKNLQQIKKLSALNMFEPMLLIAGIDQLTGAKEAYNLYTSSGNEQQNHSLLEWLNLNSITHMQHNIDACENASLQLFIYHLQSIHNNIRKTNLANNNDYQTLLANDDFLITGLQKTRNLKYKGKAINIILAMLSVILIGLFINSYIGNHVRIKKTEQWISQYNTGKTALSSKQYHFYQPKTDSWMLHIGLYQGNKIEGIIFAPHLLYNLRQELEQLLYISIKNSRHIDPVLTAYLMLYHPGIYNGNDIVSLLNKHRQQIRDKSLLLDKNLQILKHLDTHLLSSLRYNPVKLQATKNPRKWYITFTHNGKKNTFNLDASVEMTHVLTKLYSNHNKRS